MALQSFFYIIFSVVFLYFFLPQLEGIICHKCYGAQCFNASYIETIQCNDKCFIGFYWFNETTLRRGCISLSRKEPHVYVLCDTDYCNDEIIEPPLACFSCDWTDQNCIDQRPCLRPDFVVRDQCYSVMSRRRKKIKYGCLGDMSLEERVDYFRFPLEIELCDSLLCNDGSFHYLTKEIFNDDMKCYDKNNGEVSCPNNAHRFNGYCFYLDYENAKGCFSELNENLVKRYYTLKKIQVCAGRLCNKDLSVQSATRCNEDKKEWLCLRYRDRCTVAIDNTSIPATARTRGCYFSPTGFCSSSEECQTTTITDSKEIAPVRHYCYECKGKNCFIMRETAVTQLEFCREGVKICFTNFEKKERGCGPGDAECNEVACNSGAFGALCYHCDSNQYWCPVPDRSMDIIVCEGVFECIIQHNKDGSVLRDCGYGFLPFVQFCSEALCNDNPVVVDSCYVFYAKLDENYNMVRPIQKDWVEHSCPKVADRPLCYLLISEDFIEGGCTSLIKDFKPKISYGWKELNVRYIFCDEPYCNYNQVEIIL